MFNYLYTKFKQITSQVKEILYKKHRKYWQTYYYNQNEVQLEEFHISSVSFVELTRAYF